MTPDKAKAFSYLNPELQKQFVQQETNKNYLAGLGLGGQQEPMRQQEASIPQELPFSLQEQQQQVNPLFQALQQMQPKELVPGLPDRRQEAFMSALGSHLAEQQLSKQPTMEVGGQQRVPREVPVQQEQPRAPMRTGPTAQQLRMAALGAPNPHMGAQLEKMAKSMESEERHQQKLSVQERKELREDMREERRLQHKIDKDTQPVYEQIVKEAKGAKEDDRRLIRMKKLNEEGDLSSPAFHNTLKGLSKGIFGVGLDLRFLEKPDSQEFNKLSKDFIRNAKDMFGSRVTDNDLKMFLEMIPDLSQSPEGRARIIHNMQLANKAKYIRFQAAEDIMKENKGHRPLNFAGEVEKRAEKDLDKLAEEFSLGMGLFKQKNETPTFLGDIWGSLKNVASSLPGGRPYNPS